MAAPLLQAHVDINAPVARVWGLISDLRRMPEWSPQCRWMKPFGPVRQGTRTLNLNRRNHMYWPTTCTVVEIVPARKLAFRVNTNHTVWSYELQPTNGCTRVMQSRHAETGVTAFSNLSVNTLFGGTTKFERELLEGMNTSLAHLKAAAETS